MTAVPGYLFGSTFIPESPVEPDRCVECQRLIRRMNPGSHTMPPSGPWVHVGAVITDHNAKPRDAA